jgi:hypothetical protein
LEFWEQLLFFILFVAPLLSSLSFDFLLWWLRLPEFFIVNDCLAMPR